MDGSGVPRGNRFHSISKIAKHPRTSGQDIRKSFPRFPRGSTKPNRLWRRAEEPTGNRSPSGFCPAFFSICFSRCKSGRCQSAVVTDCHFDYTHTSDKIQGKTNLPLANTQLPIWSFCFGFPQLAENASYSIDLGNSNAFRKWCSSKNF